MVSRSASELCGPASWGPGSPRTVPPTPTVPAQPCFVGSGTEYRGVASTAASGLSCLAWNSDLLYQELHVDSVGAAALLGLGPHAYCRSALGGQGLSLGPDPSAWEAAQREEPRARDRNHLQKGPKAVGWGWAECQEPHPARGPQLPPPTRH